MKTSVVLFVKVRFGLQEINVSQCNVQLSHEEMTRSVYLFSKLELK